MVFSTDPQDLIQCQIDKGFKEILKDRPSMAWDDLRNELFFHMSLEKFNQREKERNEIERKKWINSDTGNNVWDELIDFFVDFHKKDCLSKIKEKEKEIEKLRNSVDRAEHGEIV